MVGSVFVALAVASYPVLLGRESKQCGTGGQQLRVRVVDALGKPVTGASVRFTTTLPIAPFVHENPGETQEADRDGYVAWSIPPFVTSKKFVSLQARAEAFTSSVVVVDRLPVCVVFVLTPFGAQ